MHPVSTKLIFSRNECEEIIKQGRELKLQQAHTQKKEYEHMRDSLVAELPLPEYRKRILTAVREAAKELGIRVHGYHRTDRPHQFIMYNTGGYYNGHKDLIHDMEPTCRKMSLVIQLTSPKAYEGGRLVFPGEGFEADGTQGMALFFPSFLIHGVSPITKGVRYSLVNWYEGPRWT